MNVFTNISNVCRNIFNVCINIKNVCIHIVNVSKNIQNVYRNIVNIHTDDSKDSFVKSYIKTNRNFLIFASTVLITIFSVIIKNSGGYDHPVSSVNSNAIKETKNK